VLIDPRDPKHLYIGMSSGGVFESTDGWRRLEADQQRRQGAVPADPDPPFGHDPHCVRLHPKNPDRLYQQNHCGIYRLDRPAERWSDIGETMPKSVGPIGFPMVLHPRDPDTLVGVSDGRLGCLAADLARRKAGDLPLCQRWQDVAAPSDRPPQSAGRGGRSSARR
jgi:hypothetical protein